LYLGLPSCLLISGFPNKIVYAFLLYHACYMPFPWHVIDFIILVIIGNFSTDFSALRYYEFALIVDGRVQVLLISVEWDTDLR
jgi:hypothetical protein